MLFSKCWTCVEAQVSVAVAVSQLECVFTKNELCVISPLSEIVLSEHCSHAETSKSFVCCYLGKIIAKHVCGQKNKRFKFKTLGMIGLMRVLRFFANKCSQICFQVAKPFLLLL